MPDESASNSFLRIVRLLRRQGVEFIVIGGQAEVIFGSPRLTYDTDLCYRRTPENLERLARALAPLHVRLRGAPADLPFKLDRRALQIGCNFTFDTDEGKLDLLGHVEPLGDYEKLMPTVEIWEVDHAPLAVISLEELIRVKEHIARKKDGESLVQLHAIKQIRDRQAP
jgi:predicted nucleotidyltransferase